MTVMSSNGGVPPKKSCTAPSAPDRAARDLWIARRFLASRITLELGVRIRVRAVSEFHMFGGGLQVWGDTRVR